MFFHHGDGIITIQKDGNLIELLLTEFIDLEPSYFLPPGQLWRQYLQGQRHILNDGTNQIGGPFPWDEGDLYISRITQYYEKLKNKNILEHTKQVIRNMIHKEYNKINTNGIEFQGNRYSIHSVTSMQIWSFSDRNFIPKDFKLRNISGKVVDCKNLDFLKNLCHTLVDTMSNYNNELHDKLERIEICTLVEDLEKMEFNHEKEKLIDEDKKVPIHSRKRKTTW